MTSELAETNANRRQAVAQQIRAGVPWGAFIECAGENPATFDPKTVGEKQPNYEQRRQAASAICERCAVIEQCLEEAYKFKDVDTFRGGLTGDERRSEAKRRRGAAIRRLHANKT